MVVKIGRRWFLSYERLYASGAMEIFDGPFRSRQAAQDKLASLSPFDRMIIAGRPPQSVTDREFLMGSCNGNQFERHPEQGDFYRKVAEAEGQNVKGKRYLSQLARYPGDPEAWVGSRGDVQKVCEERGSGSTGLVKVKAKQGGEAPKPVDVAEDILDRELATACEGQTMTVKKAKDIKESLRGKLKPSWK